MLKSDKERLKKIIETGEKLVSQIEQRAITQQQLLDDEYTQWAVTTPVYNIGEQVSHLSKELKSSYPDIPWSMVAGLRHRLVHDYDGIRWTIIAQVIYEDLPQFIEQVRAVFDGTDK